MLTKGRLTISSAFKFLISITIFLLLVGSPLLMTVARASDSSYDEYLLNGEVQWYEVNMASTGLLSVNVKSEYSNIIKITFYDPSGKDIQSQTSGYTGQLSLDAALSTAGIYKVQVSLGGLPYGRGSSNIRVSSNQPLNRISPYRSVHEAMEAGDAKWYDMVVNSSSLVCINANADHNNILTVTIFDASGNKVAEETSGYTGNNALIRTITSPGSYNYKVTAGNIPYGTTTSDVIVSCFVMPLAGTPIASKGTVTSSSAQASVQPTAATQPTSSAESGMPLFYWAIPLLFVVIIVISAGYFFLRKSGKGSEKVKPMEKMHGRESSQPDKGTGQILNSKVTTDVQEKGVLHDVFISYSSDDKHIADAVCARLEANRVRCWIAPRDILPGTNYAESILNAISGSLVFVMVFSSSADKSPHVMREVENAVNSAVPIITFRIDGTQPGAQMKYYIGPIHWLDAMTPPMEKHLNKLVETVELLLKQSKPIVTPTVPEKDNNS